MDQIIGTHTHASGRVRTHWGRWNTSTDCDCCPWPDSLPVDTLLKSPTSSPPPRPMLGSTSTPCSQLWTRSAGTDYCVVTGLHGDADPSSNRRCMGTRFVRRVTDLNSGQCRTCWDSRCAGSRASALPAVLCVSSIGVRRRL
jgi:hypothetical protein